MGRVSMAGPGTQPCCSTAVAAPWGRDKDTELVCLSLLALESSTLLALAVPPQHPLHGGQGLQGLQQAPSGVGATACCPPAPITPGQAVVAVGRVVMESQAQG